MRQQQQATSQFDRLQQLQQEQQRCNNHSKIQAQWQSAAAAATYMAAGTDPD
jgi:hypothetical protein